MKIFEVTKKPIKEAVDPAVLAKIKQAISILSANQAGADTGATQDADSPELATAPNGAVRRYRSQQAAQAAAENAEGWPRSRAGDAVVDNGDGTFSVLVKNDANTDRVMGAAQNEPATDDAGSEYRSADDLINDVEEKIISGEAQLSKAVDAQLGKTGLSAQDQYTQLMSMASEAAQTAAEQIVSQVEMDPSSRTSFYGDADAYIKGAMFVYIDVKYNNGNPNQSRVDDAMGLIRTVVANNQPRGGAQPAGRQSSARTQGQQGNVPSGGGTNALDQAADDRLRNRGI